jgi:hypothetical protein
MKAYFDAFGCIQPESRATALVQRVFLQQQIHHLDELELVAQTQVAGELIAAIEDLVRALRNLRMLGAIDLEAEGARPSRPC